jgi:hypothetical protein
LVSAPQRQQTNYRFLPCRCLCLLGPFVACQCLGQRQSARSAWLRLCVSQRRCVRCMSDDASRAEQCLSCLHRHVFVPVLSATSRLQSHQQSLSCCCACGRQLSRWRLLRLCRFRLFSLQERTLRLLTTPRRMVRPKSPTGRPWRLWRQEGREAHRFPSRILDSCRSRPVSGHIAPQAPSQYEAWVGQTTPSWQQHHCDPYGPLRDLGLLTRRFRVCHLPLAVDHDQLMQQVHPLKTRTSGRA